MKRKSNREYRSIVFARGVFNENENTVSDQIEQARRYCRSRGMRVVDAVRLNNISANDRATEDALEALLARNTHKREYDVLVTSDLSRLTRKGICHAMSMLSRFNKAGIRIVTLDCGEVVPAIFQTVKLHVPRKKKVLGHLHGKEKASNHPVRMPTHDPRGATEVQDGGDALDEGKGKPRNRTQKGN